MSGQIIETECLVLGAGPGGYTAAFRAADLGLSVVLVDPSEQLGGVCLNVGCIPSKALLHAAKVIDEAGEFAEHGIEFSKPKINLDALRTWKQGVVGRLTTGLKGLAKQRKVQVIQGTGKFISQNEVEVLGADNALIQKIHFKNVIIAVGSRPIKLPFLANDPRIMDSTGALEINNIPNHLLVIGGGIIGLEMATVYHALGSKITVVELSSGLLPGVDRDIVAPLYKRLEKRYENIYLGTKLKALDIQSDGLLAHFNNPADAGDKNLAETTKLFDGVLSAVGRVPNSDMIAADKAGIQINEKGFIVVDNQNRTNVSHIFAIGDVVGNPMLAHKAIPEGRVAAEVIAGKKHYFEPACIPSVAYTDPEVAWVGLTEEQARAQNIPIGKGVFPWMASGRSLSLGRTEGLTKLIFNPENNRILGAGIVGPNAGELISEISLAIELGCVAEDISLTIHPHPTLSETIGLAAEVFEGTITDLMPQKKDKAQ